MRYQTKSVVRCARSTPLTAYASQILKHFFSSIFRVRRQILMRLFDECTYRWFTNRWNILVDFHLCEINEIKKQKMCCGSKLVFFFLFSCLLFDRRLYYNILALSMTKQASSVARWNKQYALCYLRTMNGCGLLICWCFLAINWDFWQLNFRTSRKHRYLSKTQQALFLPHFITLFEESASNNLVRCSISNVLPLQTTSYLFVSFSNKFERHNRISWERVNITT